MGKPRRRKYVSELERIINELERLECKVDKLHDVNTSLSYDEIEQAISHLRSVCEILESE